MLGQFCIFGFGVEFIFQQSLQWNMCIVTTLHDSSTCALYSIIQEGVNVSIDDGVPTRVQYLPCEEGNGGVREGRVQGLG